MTKKGAIPKGKIIETEGNRLVIGVLTTPSRQMYLPRLLERLAPWADKLILFNDTSMRGHTWNYRRALRELGKQVSEDGGFLLCTDDMICPWDWPSHFAIMHQQAKGKLYSLFSRKRNLFTPENMQRGWVKGIHKRGFYDAASMYIGFPNLVDQVDEWMAKEGHKLIPEKRQKHMDVVVQDYFVHNGIEWVTATPSLFQHVGLISTMGHKIGGATVYIEDYEREMFPEEYQPETGRP